MSPEVWSNISYILLVTGIVFSMVTVILAVKFRLLDMLKAEFSRNSKKIRMSPGQEYFAFVEKKNHELDAIEEISASMDIKEVPSSSEPSRKISIQPVPSSADDSPSATVVISQREPEEKPAEGGTVVTAGRMDDEGFRITDSIMIVHGDPHAVTI